MDPIWLKLEKRTVVLEETVITMLEGLAHSETGIQKQWKLTSSRAFHYPPFACISPANFRIPFSGGGVHTSDLLDSIIEIIGTNHPCHNLDSGCLLPQLSWSGFPPSILTWNTMSPSGDRYSCSRWSLLRPSSWPNNLPESCKCWFPPPWIQHITRHEITPRMDYGTYKTGRCYNFAMLHFWLYIQDLEQYCLTLQV